MAQDKTMVNEDEAADITGLAPKTLANRRTLGLPPTYIRFGRRAIRYRRSDLEAWIESCTVAPEGK